MRHTLLLTLLLSFQGYASDRPMLRVHDDVLVPGGDGAGSLAEIGGDLRSNCGGIPTSFDLAAKAWHGQAAPGGGTLSPFAPGNPAMINSSGHIAFIANVNGVSRNQGCFLVDGGGLRAIAKGCGGGGGSGNPGTGCGDPSPIGGTFSGFFGGTVFAPPISDAGDVLFISDVHNGSSPRGLFLYRASSNSIIKIAAVGDLSPIGGNIAAIGPGSMNNQGQIIFLAQQANGNVNFLKWEAGVVTKYLAIGDPSPVGGTFSLLAGESFGFADGTSIPSGDVPAINEAGQVAFFALVSGGSTGRGLFLASGTPPALDIDLVVAVNEPAPGGGTFFDFQAPHLNNAGEIAFLADVRLSGGSFTTGWFAGTSGDWRRALAFFDPIGGGQCWGLAFSRNPMHALDDCGNLILWTVIKTPDNVERDATVVSHPGNSLTIIAREGDPTPIGGSYTGMQGWPSGNNEYQGMLSAFTPGASGGRLNTHFVFTAQVPCDPCDVNCDGSVNAFDIQPFVEALSPSPPAACSPCAADANGDGSVNGFDIQGFLECLRG